MRDEGRAIATSHPSSLIPHPYVVERADLFGDEEGEILFEAVEVGSVLDSGDVVLDAVVQEIEGGAILGLGELYFSVLELCAELCHGVVYALGGEADLAHR